MESTDGGASPDAAHIQHSDAGGPQDAGSAAEDAGSPLESDAGAPLDAGLADSVDLIVRGAGFTDDEGRLVWARSFSAPLSRATAFVSARIAGGAFEARIPGGMHREVFGVDVDLFIDRDEDAACGDSDTAFELFASNDFTGDPVVVFVPRSEATPSTCAAATRAP